MIEAIETQPHAASRSGILLVTLYEGQDFSLPGLEQISISHPQFTGDNGSREAGSLGSSSLHSDVPAPCLERDTAKNLPYALLDVDQEQFIVNAVSGTVTDPIWVGDGVPYKFDVCQPAELVVRVYRPNLNSVLGSEQNEDILLGVKRIDLHFEETHGYETDRGKHAKLVGHLGVELMEVQGGTGKIRIGLEYIKNKTSTSNADDFKLLESLENGSFGTLLEVQKRDTTRIYTMKRSRKRTIPNPQTAYSPEELSALFRIESPFIAPLKFSFQSPERLWLLLASPNGGDLLGHLQRDLRFDVDRSRLYAAELLCAIECLHCFDGIKRGLKPENIHLDYLGHIALCDFSLFQLHLKDDHKSRIAEYIAPELLSGRDYSKVVDWWTLGCLLYEMLTGLPPFYDENPKEMNQKILTEPLHFPGPEFFPPSAEDILTKLLNRNPDQRLGANGASEVRAHPFFDEIDWDKLYQREYEPAFKPSVSVHILY